MRRPKWLLPAAGTLLLAGVGFGVWHFFLRPERLVVCELSAAEQGIPPAGAPDPWRDTTPLSAAEIDEYAHLSEGNELIPVLLLLALEDSTTRRPFMESLERFGLLPDARSARNPYGLPVGFSSAPSEDTGMKLDLQGSNCATCHVGEIHYQGNRLRVPGGPNLFAHIEFQNKLNSAINHTFKGRGELRRFLNRLAEVDTLAPPDRRIFRDKRLLRSVTDTRVTPQDSALLEGLRTQAAEDARRLDPGDGVWKVDAAAPDSAAADELGEDMLDDLPNQWEEDLRRTVPGTRGGGGESLARQLGNLRMLLSRLNAVRALSPQRGGRQTDPGFGRNDAFDIARNMLFPKEDVNYDAPVSFPHLWDLNRTRWFHYDAVTNSVMERNLGQALGVGAGVDTDTWRSTLHPRNIHRMEVLSRRTRPPEWPAFFPAVDPAKAERGRALYVQNCAGCHVDTPNDLCFDPDSIGTDPARIRSFARPMRTDTTFTASVSPILCRLKDEAYKEARLTPQERWELNGGMTQAQTQWRTTRMYGVRPLAGAWATAPYLHNGSVPTLWDLLLPAAQRPKTFPVGHREYDPQKLGYRTDVPRPWVWTFDVSGTGNGNGGHEYGTNLTDAERWDLLEYLKVHREHRGPAPRPAWVRECPRGPS